MKILAPFEKLLTPYILILLNLAIILAAEFVGGGAYFSETGIMHGIAIVFVGLIIARIFSDYAFSDRILRGFLNIQLSFFLFFGLVHVYEYLGLHFLELGDKIVELSVAWSYLLWIIGVILALEFVFRIYRKKSMVFTAFLSILLAVGFIGLVGVNAFPLFAESLPAWLPIAILVLIVSFGAIGIFFIKKTREIMPVFEEYSHYAIPAMVLVILAAFSEYLESTGSVSSFGISEIQNLYIAHFLVYAAASLLLVGFGKLKKPTGIYSEM